MREYYTVKELSELLKVNEKSIRNKIKSKEIKAKFFLNKYFISGEEVKRLLEPEQ